jgi:hypothetical protein
VREVLQQREQAGIAVAGLAQVRLRVEVDIAKNTFQLGAVGMLYLTRTFT